MGCCPEQTTTTTGALKIKVQLPNDRKITVVEKTRSSGKRRQSKGNGRALRLIGSTAKWIRAGRPIRTPEEIASIFDHQCSTCHIFISRGKTKGKCGTGKDGNGCGCWIRREGAHLNKAYMATEHCWLEDNPKW